MQAVWGLPALNVESQPGSAQPMIKYCLTFSCGYRFQVLAIVSAVKLFHDMHWAPMQ
jgi:hypothetical protein